MTAKTKNIGTWVLKILAALILLQTLFFKFSGAEESINIFTQVGMEPWGRIGSGIVELIAAILILIPTTTAFGALLGMAVMSGAMYFHITILGIVRPADDFPGQLFIYASVVFVCCAALAIIYKSQIVLLLVSLKIIKPNKMP